MNIRKCVFVLATVMAAAWLLWLLDDGLGTGWPPIVLRNWQQYGIFTLHGALITNVAGFEALTHPQIYFGMSPFYLYPVYACDQAFAWTGLGALPFHIFLAAAVVWGVWSLLGRNNWGVLVAALVILSPGYGRWQKVLDPNAISVLLGIPYAALVTHLLRQSGAAFQRYTIIGLATVLFVPLNWTTAWFLVPFGIFLLFDPTVRRPSSLVYLTLTAIGALLFVFISMHYKSSGNASSSGGAGEVGGRFLGGYTWGSYGYYEGLSTVRFFARLFFTNVVGLLPLLGWWLWRTARCMASAPRNGWISILPLLMAVLEAVAMRNYFCHHPWMGAPVIIVGLLLSLGLQTATMETPQPVEVKLRGLVLGATVAFLYGLAVIMMLRVNGQDSMAFVHFMREKVVRTESVVVVKAVDPTTAGVASSLSAEVDRYIQVVDTLAEVPRGTACVILSAQPIERLHLVAEMEAGQGSGFTGRLAHWFNQTIARRKANDRIPIAAHYYLYQPAL